MDAGDLVCVAVQADLRLLCAQRPPDISADDWEFVTSWTHNLHGNCAFPGQFTDRRAADEFRVELHARLDQPVGLDTIEWVWASYPHFTKGGQRYADKYHPLRDPDRPAGSGGRR